MGCAVDRECNQVRKALQSVMPDSEGYLPREAVFKAARISEADLMPSKFMLSDGYAFLACDAHIEFTERCTQPTTPTPKNIDDILNNPNRTMVFPNQLDSVVIIQNNREIFRFDSRAKEKAWHFVIFGTL